MHGQLGNSITPHKHSLRVYKYGGNIYFYSIYMYRYRIMPGHKRKTSAKRKAEKIPGNKKKKEITPGEITPSEKRNITPDEKTLAEKTK